MIDEIKPCPHCGGEAALYRNYSRRCRSYFVYVRCEICGAQGKLYGCQEAPEAHDWKNAACCDAVKAWNMRTEGRSDE